MKPYYQTEYSGQTNTYKIMRHEFLTYSALHFHQNYELFFAEDGQTTVFIDNQYISMTKDDILLIHPNQIHAYLGTHNSPCRLAIFSPDCINTFYRNHLNMKPEKIVTKYSPTATEFIKTNLYEYNNEYAIKACFYAACSEVEKQTTFTSVANDTLALQSQKILHFIEQNFLKEITLHQCAEELHYNYKYLSRILNMAFGQSFNDIVNQYRIKYACDLLNHSDYSITQIAFESGFDNIRTFNRNFIKMMHTPPPSI